MTLRSILIFLAVMGWLVACSKPAPTAAPAVTLVPPTPTMAAPLTPGASISETPAWIRDAILYEIYPRSFYDSNGDGIGDLKGVTSRLDYIQTLGANTLWLTPVFSSTSPHGFDVVDFYTVAPSLGTKDDLIELVQQAHNRKMRVVMDLVVAYTSNQFPQFKESLGKPDSRYSDWYQWSNNAHTTYKSYANVRAMPLLNHQNPAVQTYFLQVARYWLTIGVDGFRLGDATSVPHEFWKALRLAIKQANSEAILLGEVWESDPKKLPPYLQDEFDALFDVPLYYTLAGNPDRDGGGWLNGRTPPGALDTALSPTTQLVRFTGAHNTNRVASLVGQDAARKRLAAVLLLTLPGTPLIYYGNEIGMPGSLGVGALADAPRRAPMDWTKSGKGAGVTQDLARTNKPDDSISVEEQQNAPNSLLSLYRLLVKQRVEHAALRSGAAQPAVSECKSCYAYLRWDANDLYLVAFNLSGETRSVTFDLTQPPRSMDGPGQDVLRGGVVNLPSNGRYTLTMEPWEARLLRWGKQ
jgi:alpha-amylase